MNGTVYPFMVFGDELLPDGCFHEYGHIHGCVDMYAEMKALLEEQQRRIKQGRRDIRMPVRPRPWH